MGLIAKSEETSHAYKLELRLPLNVVISQIPLLIKSVGLYVYCKVSGERQ